MAFAGGPLFFEQCLVFGGSGPDEVLDHVDAAARLPEPFATLTADRPLIAGLGDAWPLIMGIVNVTPDSFHDGGQHHSTATAISHGREMAAAGAQILDVGGESTRPGAAEVSEAEELDRVIPVIEALAADGNVVSIDTRKPAVMAGAVSAGAAMINDVTALRFHPGSIAQAAALDVPVILMHSRGEPSTMGKLTDYDDVVMDVLTDLSERVTTCADAGIDRHRILLDPGLGFAKVASQSMTLLRDMARFHALGCPLLIGASRKSFIGHFTDTPDSTDRLPGSIVAAVWAAQQGAAILRVHDVAETAQALVIYKSLCCKDTASTFAR